ncbi:MAG: hypothetical protein KF765_09240 [Parvibaculaceae bacterium]|nr:hypothetical protein [Parvibaculaceae bacterium]
MAYHMEREPKHTYWLVQGAIGGFVAAALVGTIMVTVLATEIFKDYQTFFGALIALLGALATIWVLRRQIRQADDFENDRRERSCFASRSVMPAALSVLGRYSDDCMRQLIKLHPQSDQDVVLPPSAPDPLFPEIPSESIPVLREVAQYADRPIAETIADLLGHLQVMNSRLCGLHRNLLGYHGPGGAPYQVRVYHIENLMIDAAELNARVASLFEYARRKSNDAPTALSRANLLNALFIMGVGDLTFPDVTKKVSEFYPNG